MLLLLLLAVSYMQAPMQIGTLQGFKQVVACAILQSSTQLLLQCICAGAGGGFAAWRHSCARPVR